MWNHLSALGLNLSPPIPHPAFSLHGRCPFGLSGQQAPSEATAVASMAMTGD